MRLFIIIDETVFFHPDFLTDFLNRTRDRVVGACLVTKVGKKNNIESYMVRNFRFLTLGEMWGLGTAKIKLTLKSLFDRSKSYTVRDVLKRNNIPFIDVEYKLGTEETVRFIREKKPDVIISSQSLYVNKEILSIPSICCINRHSGLLPNNGGLWPGFQAVRKGEPYTGTSIHTMTDEIDKGVVLSQIPVKIEKGDSLWKIYEQCFRISSDALLEALEKIRNNDFSPVENGLPSEYYSFPTAEQWKEFREKGGRYI